MYLTKNLILLEMPKAGSTFMRRFIGYYYGGDNIKKNGIHNGIKDRALKEKVLSGDITVVSTIRNPFDWYVSLFAWCSMGEGLYRDIGLKRFEFSIDGAKSLIKNPLILFRSLSRWEEVFQDPKSPALFQKWVRLMLEEQPHYINRAFGKAGKHIGYCTYRFLNIHTYNFYRNFNELNSNNSIEEFYNSHKLPITFLKTESLTDDILTKGVQFGLEENRINEVLETISNKKMMRANSTDRLPYTDYYNQKTIDLIYEKDSFIIDKFNYAF